MAEQQLVVADQISTSEEGLSPPGWPKWGQDGVMVSARLYQTRGFGAGEGVGGCGCVSGRSSVPVQEAVRSPSPRPLPTKDLPC